MAKNITVQLHNAISGEIELFASRPMTNGNRQTAPVFSQKVQITNGVATITGVQETPADKSWHYHAIIRPDWRRCGSSEGSAQFRFFVPASVPSTVNLVDLPSSWAWTQNGTNYAWLGTPNASQSVEVEGGQIIRTNVMSNPSFEAGTVGFVGTRCTISSSADRAWVGTKSMKLVVAGTGATYVAASGIPATPGLEYTSTFRVFALPGIGYVNHNLAFYNATGALISPEYSTGYSQVPSSLWTLRKHKATAPAGTATMRVLVNLRSETNSNPTAGATAYIDAMYLGKEGAYFDGNSKAV